MSEVFVLIKSKEEDNEHEAQFQMSDTTELQKTIIIHNVFNVLGVANDLSQMVEDYVKIGKAYNSFFNDTSNIESEPLTEIQEQVHDGKHFEQKHYSKTILAKEYDKVLSTKEVPKEKEVKEIDNVLSKEEPEDDTPEHYKTGIMLGNPNKYQCRYVCDCGNSRTIYIEKTKKQVHCSNCNKTFNVRWAKKGYLEQDSWKNFFIAGKYIGEDEE